MSNQRRLKSLAPQVEGLEVRDVPAQIGVAHVASIHAASQSGTLVLPIRQLAGQWYSVFNATAVGKSMMPGLPATTQSTVETKLSGNRLDTRVTGGSMPNGWAYSISGDKNGRLTYSMTDPFDSTKVLNAPGKRIGVASWAFTTDLKLPSGDDKLEVIFTFVNRDNYAVATSMATAKGYVPLYVVSNYRIKS